MLQYNLRVETPADGGLVEGMLRIELASLNAGIFVLHSELTFPKNPDWNDAWDEDMTEQSLLEREQELIAADASCPKSSQEMISVMNLATGNAEAFTTCRKSQSDQDELVQTVKTTSKLPIYGAAFILNEQFQGAKLIRADKYVLTGFRN